MATVSIEVEVFDDAVDAVMDEAINFAAVLTRKDRQVFVTTSIGDRVYVG